MSAETATAVKVQEQLKGNSFSLIHFIAYFDVFEFPLTETELINCCGRNTDKIVFEEELNYLITLKKIQKTDEFFHLPGRENNIGKRKENELRAAKFISKVPVWVRLIARFPFVRSVCISGSLSKGTMHKKGDVDFFIITEPGKLWICRTLLILFKKIFLFNSKKYFCVNYFLDTQNLEVPDKNIFTATEIVFLLPASGMKYYEEFMKSNQWVKEFYPDFVHPYSIPVHNRKPLFRFITEMLLNNKSGEKLDNYFMQITLKRWKKKFSHFREEDFEVAMRTRKNVSKHHPNHFQEKIMAKYLSNLGECGSVDGKSNFK